VFSVGWITLYVILIGGINVIGQVRGELSLHVTENTGRPQAVAATPSAQTSSFNPSSKGL
jgi:hypothetical protein